MKSHTTAALLLAAVCGACSHAPTAPTSDVSLTSPPPQHKLPCDVHVVPVLVEPYRGSVRVHNDSLCSARVGASIYMIVDGDEYLHSEQVTIVPPGGVAEIHTHVPAPCAVYYFYVYHTVTASMKPQFGNNVVTREFAHTMEACPI